MRGLPNSATTAKAPSGGPAPSTVSVAPTMPRYGYEPLEGTDTTDAQPATTAFDARERLEGTYDGLYFQFRSAGMAHGFSAAVGGGE